MAKTKVLITVKTYPTLSAKYDELVCTAGFKEDGSFIRIYPIAFRKKDYAQQYKKYEWIEIDLEKNNSDFRPESYRPHAHETEIKIGKFIDTTNYWEERKKIVLQNVRTNLTQIIQEAHNQNICTSLVVFKPTKILDFQIEIESREWDKDTLEKIEAERQQLNLFKQPEDHFKVVKKLPYKFSYVFEDDLGKKSTLMIEDWEIGQLYWNCLKKHNDEEIACQKVQEKYFDDFAKTKDLHFFLGTTKKNHYVSRNPFIIIGTFHPTIDQSGQISLFK